MEASNLNSELDRLLRNMAAKEEPIPKGFSTPKEFGVRWNRSTDRASEVLRRAFENGLAERRQISRRCGPKTMKIWVYKLN